MRLKEEAGIASESTSFPTRAKWVKQPQPPQVVIQASYGLILATTKAPVKAPMKDLFATCCFCLARHCQTLRRMDV
jgi:hypothetical protein